MDEQNKEILKIERKKNKSFFWSLVSTIIVFLILGGVFTYGFLEILSLKKDLNYTKDILSQNSDSFSKNITSLFSRADGLSDSLLNTQQNIDNVKTQIGNIEGNIGSISGAVGTLEKLAKIDPELLKKYSKVYFLNENYTPTHLIDIPEYYLYWSSRPEMFLTEAWPFLKSLLDSAKASGVEIYVASAYRSFAEQQSLKSYYTVVYGPDTANSFSADQGYSEHQLGITVDFLTTGIEGKLDERFDKTDAFKWLASNAYRFGFSLSYPENNSHYVYEPWHWRFVGVKLAAYLHDNNLNFYDMDQRDIDNYLVYIFD
ncbi:M15 family metallopeptidase [Candidatus Wolfebacteria bacterium]|nr:M15 family metallopeptidase [Candidatus Wolfebacteria bacterium]